MLDFSLKPGITQDDVEMAGPAVFARMVEWSTHAAAGLVLVGTHWDTVSTWDVEGECYWEDIVVEAWVDAEALQEARRLRTWWDMAAQVGFEDWA